MVIELMFPAMFARDFQLPLTTIGHRHLMIWNDTIVRSEKMPPAMDVDEVSMDYL